MSALCIRTRILRLNHPPLPEEDHAAAYRAFLHPTKEDAIKSFDSEVGRRARVDPPGRQPRGRDFEWICAAYVQEDGSIECIKRVARLDFTHSYVKTINLDEDFLIYWKLLQAGRDFRDV